MSNVGSISRLPVVAIVLAIATCSIATASPIYNNVHTTNWAGYGTLAPTSTAFTSVTASWTVPTIAPTANDTYLGMWVGLDGLTNSTVEQIGILANYVAGVPSYYGFYETFPSSSVGIDSVTINPGDSLTALITYIGLSHVGDLYRMSLTDNTTGETFSEIAGSGFVNQRANAEWIVEAPTVDGAIAPLSNFGSATFTGASATLNALSPSPISALNNVGIDLISPTNSSAFASALDPSGTSFTVTEAPEPSTLALAAFAGLLLRRRR